MSINPVQRWTRRAGAGIVAVLAASALAAAAPAQKPSGEVTTIDAKLGSCSADFTVTGADHAAVYDASIHVRVRYGAFSLKRMDLEVGTNSDGKARVQGLPAKAKPLVYDVSKDGRHASVTQDLAVACHAAYDVILQ
jgi:hypothetical protein